jgi:imidazoleglycerol-phosphate dehydratase
MGRAVEIERITRETEIHLKLDMNGGESRITTGLPFFDHLLEAMAFHGAMSLNLTAKGDIDRDPHHLVEDVGISLGLALGKTVREYGHIDRFGQAVIPMDDALAEAVIDAGGRPYLVYRAEFPQSHCGNFDTALLREFFLGVVNGGRINLHLHGRYGENSHHIAEALFKTFGRALRTAYRPRAEAQPASTKGTLEEIDQ